jgi:SAM-dependent methyltransferase
MIGDQYATGLSRQNIERALLAAGKDLDHLSPADLGTLEDFHTMGRIATGQLAELAAITSGDRVLDAGTGIGGTARFLADRYGCQVTAVDLTEEYCETARWLNRLVGLAGKISVGRADVTRLPFGDAAFDVAFSQHVQMNVADKARLYAEARRILAPGGRLAIWDITAGPSDPSDPSGLTGMTGGLEYPLPWADRPDRSHLAPPAGLRATIESAGFVVERWNDLTDPAAGLMRAVLARPVEPLGLHAFVPDFAAKAGNLTAALASGRLRVIQAIAVAA